MIDLIASFIIGFVLGGVSFFLITRKFLPRLLLPDSNEMMEGIDMEGLEELDFEEIAEEMEEVGDKGETKNEDKTNKNQ